MQSISECFDEYHKRWRKVEHICGFQVCSSPSSPTHIQSPTHSSQNIGHKYHNSQTYSISSSMPRDLSTNSIATYVTLDGIGLSLRRGSTSSGGGGEMPAGYGALHRSSTLPRFRGKSNSVTPMEADSSVFYQQPKSRSSSVSSSSTTSSSQALLLRSYKSAGPPLLTRQQSTDSGDVDIADYLQLVGNQHSQHVPSQIQHHQLHLSSVTPANCKRPEADTIAESREGPDTAGQVTRPRPPLKSSASLPAFLIRKDSYHEAINSGGEVGGGSNEQQGELTGGITFTTPSDNNSCAGSSRAQSSNETKPASKLPAGYRAASNAGLEAIKEEIGSQISLTSSGGSSDVSSSRSGSQSMSRASSSSPDKPKVKRRSPSPRATSGKARNHRSISSDV